MSLQHLAGDLRIARLVGSDEAKLIASDGGHQTVEQEKSAHENQERKFTGRDSIGMIPEPTEQAG
jgi:hypothetical protein